MIKVTAGNNTNRTTVIVPSDTTLRKVLEDANIDYTVGVMHLDGIPLEIGDLDRTFEDMGITDRCYLLNVLKMDNA